MKAMAESGKPVILCLMAGSDIDMSYAAENFDAVMVLWYPGGQGGKAAAKVLFGEISPSGKLPVTFYESLEELPEFTDYSMKGRTYRYLEGKAQYPFGYGLTYSQVKVTDARIISDENEILAEVKVQNTGCSDTRDVVQIYIKNLDSAYAVKNPELAAFEGVFLKAGEAKTITIPVAQRAFTIVDDEGVRKEDGKHFAIYAGCSQPDERSVELTGIKPVEILYQREGA